MAKKIQDEDLFANSTMTFGEHLEELRGTLTRALFGLAIGFVVSLLIADNAVQWIETPLRNALEAHYQKVALVQLDERYEGNVPEQAKRWVADRSLAPDVVYIESADLRELVAELAPEVPMAETLAAETSTNEDNGAAEESSKLLTLPIWRPVNVSIQTLSAHEAFMIWLKAALVVGMVLSSPWVFFQIWNFIAAGLYPHEKNYVYLYMPMSLGLFFCGAALAFFFVFEPVLNFLFGFNRQMNIDTQPRISEWISFVLFLPLGFGISFQLPLVMLLLERIGVFTIQTYLSSWRIAVLIIFVLAMFLTPADPVSMLLMALPLTMLFFGGIGLCKWLPKRSSPIGPGIEP